MSQQSGASKPGLKDKGAADPSPMLESYLKSSPTIVEELQVKYKNSGNTTKAVKIKETEQYLNNWGESWVKMAASRK